jgi:hypothetical protein
VVAALFGRALRREPEVQLQRLRRAAELHEHA